MKLALQSLQMRYSLFPSFQGIMPCFGGFTLFGVDECPIHLLPYDVKVAI